MSEQSPTTRTTSEKSSKNNILATLTRLCTTSNCYIPSLDLESDGALKQWTTVTNDLLDRIDGGSSTADQKVNPEMLLCDFVSLFQSHLSLRGYSSTSDSLGLGLGTQQQQTDENNAEENVKSPKTPAPPTKNSSSNNSFSLGQQNNSNNNSSNNILQVKGAAQLLRHGNDVARVSRMAQRLAEEVASLQQAKIRMTSQHAQELNQQAASYREIICELLEQLAKVERQLSDEMAKKRRVTSPPPPPKTF